MNNIPTLLMTLIFGTFTTVTIFYVFHKRQISTILLSNTSLSARVSELEMQLSKQAENHSNQLATIFRTHSDELDRLTRERRQLEGDHLNAINTKVREAQDRAFEDGKRQAELRADEKAKAFSLTVRPYIRKIRDDGFLRKMNKIEIGYQYQLQINGIPCFDPHIVIEQHYEEKEVNQEVIERMTRLAIQAAQTAVAIQAGPAGALIPIATSPIIEG